MLEAFWGLMASKVILRKPRDEILQRSLVKWIEFHFWGFPLLLEPHALLFHFNETIKDNENVFILFLSIF